MDLLQQIPPELIEELIRRAQEAYKNAYVPYSHYPVGAATLWESGRIIAGCNVENASYGLTICAERNSVFHAAYHGERRLRAVAVAVPTDVFPSPCGACRQVLREFSQDCLVILVNGKGQTKMTRLNTLLPDSFGPEFLG
ncbi:MULTISPECIES: cytidine deaminase [Desulfitobacterium]|uniref:Cytidine deaminase n=1 Tax=Desulfitobacterium dehalogenans (strain ATCC 51507 / DSM 9161 / JW/IU-DC1) TaxID=756499 RepID=I4AD80_DESDJ|nr:MULTISPECIES: cytidine deaminase [Desulfitobacterium]AFM01915.1 cytidine deaminase [Desulfitobacterium dehalogenans ATCC 51507]